ncbi:hypothetical protein K450DRAFT_224919 [Umbelopsis ramanniana AG]|uniref:Uncharacterized protein n=1 Tax=Umbelopsis ramanniana AG TaxID=1314678 RepID=A0AAD5EGI8_UMBRA|nr:uncharacterized protein K450DRAFT_224919 [Umbelopsis ramanniana AG]KAI8582814.1 hypothetical protein K450DRAFT_224919 [Umbelopsis ramanniana AG]
MPAGSSLADIAQKSVVLLLAGSTVYYVVNIGVMVNRRMELKKQGRLDEELAKLARQRFGESANVDASGLHSETLTTPTPLPMSEQPGASVDKD